MLSNTQEQICPICNDTYAKRVEASVDGNWVSNWDCERCGKYSVGFRIASLQPWKEVRHLVSAWIRRENISGEIPNITIDETDHLSLYPEKWSARFNSMGFPSTVNEKLDALLLSYSKSIENVYGRQFSFGRLSVIADIAARNQEEVNGLNDLLDELGFIDKKFPKITAKGWLHLDELQKSPKNSNSAFVAMWFDDTTKKYREAVVAAISHCGYKPVIIDQQEYNDFIMNQVVSSIKQSRFLVADFTSRPEIEKDGKVRSGVRGGVYWEAGMAYGLGVPVIHTCEDHKDSSNRIHFDVHQYNTIFWKPEELGTEIRPLDQSYPNPNFAEKLSSRILATVGKGNYVPEK